MLIGMFDGGLGGWVVACVCEGCVGGTWCKFVCVFHCQNVINVRVFLYQIPLIIPILVVIASLYLIVAPIIDNPSVGIPLRSTVYSDWTRCVLPSCALQISSSVHAYVFMYPLRSVVLCNTYKLKLGFKIAILKRLLPVWSWNLLCMLEMTFFHNPKTRWNCNIW